LLATLSAADAIAASADAPAFFESHIRPVLIDRCYQCHSAQAKAIKAGFLLDTREGLLKGGDSGKPAIVPGNAEASPLIEAVRYGNPDFRMPPKGKLPEEQVADLVKWINSGAPDPRNGSAGLVQKNPAASAKAHWAFQPLKKPVAPEVRDASWPISAIDRFVLARLEQKGLKPVGDAPKPALIRRATFDLTGLPPTPEEVEDFVRDSSTGAFARVIDRLLNSVRYGERWGRHWMDVVRYADTAGDNADYPIPEARLYRDYIIDSFNSDKPYDRFVQEQLAGDILAKQEGNYTEPIIATGFLALSRRYATAPFELWHLTIEDTIETTGRAFMGLTLRCARCHDHKYDPITKEDYYGLYGFFASTQFPYAGSEEFSSKGFPRSGFVPLVSPEQSDPMVQEYSAQIAVLQDEIKQAKDAGAAARDRLKKLEADLAILQKPGLPACLAAAYAVSEGKATDVPLQIKGEPDQLGPVIRRHFPMFLAGQKAVEIRPGTSGRLELAQWLTRKDHPLTARVMVNRIWQHHFGKGIVATPSNFGTRGEPPSNLELIDYLAAEFIDSGWSLKAMHRQIMLSRVYKLGGTDDNADAAVDPDNKFLWRMDRRRLEAEAIRDAMLAAGGNLDLNRPGPHTFPLMESWKFTQHAPFKAVYESKHRSVYLMTQRIQRHPFLSLFDGPDTNTSTDARTDSTVPLQALFMMNNPFVTQQAQGLAQRWMTLSTDPRERVRNGIAMLYARTATEPEVDRALAYIEQYKKGLAQAEAPAGKVEAEAWTSYARVLLCANEFVYVD
jgi:hypothetical protein